MGLEDFGLLGAKDFHGVGADGFGASWGWGLGFRV